MAGAATRPVPPPEAAAGASAVDQRTARWVMQLDDCWCVAGCLWLALIGGCDCGPSSDRCILVKGAFLWQQPNVPALAAPLQVQSCTVSIQNQGVIYTLC
jgi:hypothetical protein